MGCSSTPIRMAGHIAISGWGCADPHRSCWGQSTITLMTKATRTASSIARSSARARASRRWRSASASSAERPSLSWRSSSSRAPSRSSPTSFTTSVTPSLRSRSESHSPCAASGRRGSRASRSCSRSSYQPGALRDDPALRPSGGSDASLGTRRSRGHRVRRQRAGRAGSSSRGAPSLEPRPRRGRQPRAHRWLGVPRGRRERRTRGLRAAASRSRRRPGHHARDLQDHVGFVATDLDDRARRDGCARSARPSLTAPRRRPTTRRRPGS